MTIHAAFREGMRRLNRARRVWLLFYVAATIPALLATAVLLAQAYDSLGNSTWARQMAGNLDISWIAELGAKHGGPITAPWPAILFGCLAIFGAVYVLLLGGALEVLCAGGDFTGGCGKHFWRLARLSLYAGLCALAPLLLNRLLAKLGDKLWGEGSAVAPLVYWGWFRAAILLCLLALVNLAFEYAAIQVAVEDTRKVWRALLGAFRGIARHPGKTIGLYALLSLLLLLVMALGLGISRAVAQTSMTAVVVLFVVRQAAVLAKTWVWLAFFAAQGVMYQAIAPAAPAPQPEAAEEIVAPTQITEELMPPTPEERPAEL